MGVMCACIGLWFGLVSADPAPTLPQVEPIAYSMRGNVSQYAPGLMSTVVANRLHWQHVDVVHGLPIAVQDCRLLGKRGVATFDDFGRFPVTVVDCLAPHHSSELFDAGVIFEVGHPFAKAHGFVGRGGIWASLEIDQ